MLAQQKVQVRKFFLKLKKYEGITQVNGENENKNNSAFLCLGRTVAGVCEWRSI